jgi:VWFA-related protein
MTVLQVLLLAWWGFAQVPVGSPNRSPATKPPAARTTPPPAAGPVAPKPPAATPITAATPAAPVAEQEDAVKLAADLVLISAIVLKDEDSTKLVSNLGVDDFVVLDEGKPQLVEFFGDETMPLDIVFLFDASQSVEFRQKLQRDAMYTFLTGLLLSKDFGSVIWFNNKTYLGADFTSSEGRLMAAVDAIPAGGATALYDSIVVAASRLATRQGRRTILILSDGRDTFSDTRLEQALAAAHGADVVIYAINTSYPAWAVNEEFKRNDPLEYLAEETGGEVFYINKPEQAGDLLEVLSKHLRQRYTLGFYPTDLARGRPYRRLQVQVKKRGTRVLARAGYYAR